MEQLPTQNTRPKGRVIFNVVNTQYEIIKKVGESLGYRLSLNDEDEWDLYWYDLGIDIDVLSKMKPYQKVNHFPGMNGIAKKNHLGRNLCKMKKAFPEQYNFFPKTWLLPTDWSALRANLSKNKGHYYIVKPEGLSQGQGIFLTKTFDEVNPLDHLVAQRYLQTPYLINGLKFDLRIYVLVYGCDPLRIYIYREGLARFCTESYSIPSPTNSNNLYMHLTNYAINKNSDKYIFNKDPSKTDIGHKRSLTSIWRHIDSHGGSSENIIREIKSQIVKTIFSVQPSLSHIYHSCQANDLKNDMCFEILGFDVILDSDLRPYILEVNQAPSFNTDSPFDESVKSSLLTETFKILNLKSKNRTQFYKSLRAETEERVLRGKHKKYTQQERKEEIERRMSIRDAYERSVQQNYTLIYPDPTNNYYESLLEGAKIVFSGMTLTRKKQIERCENEERGKYKKLTPFRIGGQLTIYPLKTVRPMYDMSKVKSKYLDFTSGSKANKPIQSSSMAQEQDQSDCLKTISAETNPLLDRKIKSLNQKVLEQEMKLEREDIEMANNNRLLPLEEKMVRDGKNSGLYNLTNFSNFPYNLHNGIFRVAADEIMRPSISTQEEDIKTISKLPAQSECKDANKEKSKETRNKELLKRTNVIAAKIMYYIKQGK